MLQSLITPHLKCKLYDKFLPPCWLTSSARAHRDPPIRYKLWTARPVIGRRSADGPDVVPMAARFLDGLSPGQAPASVAVWPGAVTRSRWYQDQNHQLLIPPEPVSIYQVLYPAININIINSDHVAQHRVTPQLQPSQPSLQRYLQWCSPSGAPCTYHNHI